MKFVKKAWFVFLLAAFALSACGEATQTPDEASVMLTEGVGTMVASFFGTQTAMFTPATNTAAATQTPFSTVTPFASPTFPASPTLIYYTATLGTLTPGTPTPTGTVYTPTVNPGSLAYGCNNLAFIRDVTIPAGTVLQKNQDFTKTWKVQNTGACDWMYQYQLVLLSGDPFGGKNTKIQKRVTVGDWSELSISMGAPNKTGTFTSYWRLADPDGHMFGATLAVSFKVEEPPTAVPPSATFTNTPVPTAETPSLTPVPTTATP